MRAPKGSWQVAGRAGIVAVGAALLPTRQLVFYARPEDPPHGFGAKDSGLPNDGSHDPNGPDLTLSTVVDFTGPIPWKPVKVDLTYNPFCAGLTHLADGRLLIAGGDKKDDRLLSPQEIHDNGESNNSPFGTRDGRRALRVFDPKRPGESGTGGWRDVGRLSDNRWYPTCTLLPDGRIFVVSGYIDDMLPSNNQNPTGETIPPMAGGPQFLSPLVEAWPHDSFPFVYALPSGSVFLFAGDSAYFLDQQIDPWGRERWKIGPAKKTLPRRDDGRAETAKLYPNTASAVLLPLHFDNYADAEVLIVGGGGVDVHPQWNTLPGSPTPTFRVPACDQYFRLKVDPPESRGEWRRGQPRSGKPQARVMPDAVLLPDGTVLVVNGANHGYAGGAAGTGPARPYDFEQRKSYAVFAPDLYDPRSETWHRLAPTIIPRLYHSVALLMPDARVLIAGSDHQVNIGDDQDSNAYAQRNYHAGTFEYRIEMFTPPYLQTEVARPIIDASSEYLPVAYGESFPVSVTNLADLNHGELRATLLKLGASTHSNNMGQRCVELKVRVDPSGKGLTLDAPPDTKVAPPGYYMLFVLNEGKPSEARFVRLPLLPADDAVVIGELRRDCLKLWLRSDTGLMADATGVATSWSDLSGCGNDLFWRSYNDDPAMFGQPQPQPHSQPDRDNPPPDPRPQRVLHAMNGHPVLRFSLCSQWKAAGSIIYGSHLQAEGQEFMTGPGSYTIFAVAHVWPPGHPRQNQSYSDGGWGDLLGWGNFTGPGETGVGLRFGAGPYQHPGTDDQLPLKPGMASLFYYHNSADRFARQTAPLVSMAEPVLLEVVYDGEGGTCLRINGEQHSVPPASGPRTMGPGPFTLGRNGADGAFFRGDIAEVVIYDTALEPAKLDQIRDYLRRRYDLRFPAKTSP